MRRFARGRRHLRRKHAAWDEHRGQPRKKHVVVGKELQRPVGENEVRAFIGRPIRDVLLNEANRRGARLRVFEHRLRRVDAGDPSAGKTAGQKFGAVARSATEVVDDPGRSERHARKKIARRAHPLLFEFHVKGRIPVPTPLGLDGTRKTHSDPDIWQVEPIARRICFTLVYYFCQLIRSRSHERFKL